MVRNDGFVKSDASLTGAADPKNAYFDSVTFLNQSDGTAGMSPSTIPDNAYNRAWVSEDKDDCLDTILSTMPGSKKCEDAWKEMAEIWVDECVTVYVGQELATWSHHKDLVIDYSLSDIYIWNWYWKNHSAYAE